MIQVAPPTWKYAVRRSFVTERCLEPWCSNANVHKTSSDMVPESSIKVLRVSRIHYINTVTL